MIITKDMLIKRIAKKEGFDTAAVQRFMEAAEDVIFCCLISDAPTEDLTMKIFTGISLERTYISQKTISRGMFQNLECQRHVRIKANASKYYNCKVNEALHLDS